MQVHTYKYCLETYCDTIYGMRAVSEINISSIILDNAFENNSFYSPPPTKAGLKNLHGSNLKLKETSFRGLNQTC